jgi:multimeric flavodoxin WrbA
MTRVFAINGSPRMAKGNTAVVLEPYLEGMMEAGAEVERVYVGQLDVQPCTGEMRCWYSKPGACYIQDEMQALYPKLRAADLLVLATPVYIPLPGRMQDLINRLCPLVVPELETREGRTRARFRDDVRIKQIVLVATGGWWERGNFGTVERIAEELAVNANVEYAGAVLRPHASLLRQGGDLAAAAEAVLEAARQAGYDLIREGAMKAETLAAISRPLVPQEAYRRHLNQMLP